MKFTYKNCAKKKSAIDKLLAYNASLQSSLGVDSTPEDKLIVQSETHRLMSKIKAIDSDFYDYINPKRNG